MEFGTVVYMCTSDLCPPFGVYYGAQQGTETCINGACCAGGGFTCICITCDSDCPACSNGAVPRCVYGRCICENTCEGRGGIDCFSGSQGCVDACKNLGYASGVCASEPPEVGDCPPGNCCCYCVGREECNDNKDNDGDGLVDCADPDCAGIDNCCQSDADCTGYKCDTNIYRCKQSCISDADCKSGYYCYCGVCSSTFTSAGCEDGKCCNRGYGGTGIGSCVYLR